MHGMNNIKNHSEVFVKLVA